MADKSQNIFINYKFPMAEAEKASQVLNRVNQVNNLVQTGAQKTGQVLSTAYSSAGKSIEAMSIQLARLKTQIQVSSDPKRVAELSNQYKNLKTQIDAANKSALGTSQALKQTQQSAQSATQSFGGLFNAVKLIVTAGLAKEVVDIAINMADLTGRVEGVSRAFNRAFPDAENLLFNLKKATHGTITEFDLMAKTLQATNLGIAVENLPTLFEFAAVRAQQTGESVENLTNSIVNGIGRKSSRVIDNLGISATRLKEQFHGVSLETLSVAEVTKGVSEIMREELGKMGGYAENASTKVLQLTAATQRFKEEVGKALTQEGGFIDFLKDYVETFGDAIEAQNRGIAVSELAEEQRIKEIANISANEFATRVLTGTKEENIKAIEEEIGQLTKSIGVYADQRDAVDKTITKLKSLLTGYLNEDIQIKKNIQTQKDYLEPKRENAFIDQEILKILMGKLEALKQVDAQEVISTGIIQRKKKEIEALQKALEESNKLSDLGVGGRLTKALEIAQAELGDLQRALSDIDPKPFVLNMEKATRALTDFASPEVEADFGTMMERILGRVGDGFARLAEMKPVLPTPKPTYTDTFWDKLGDEVEKNWKDITSTGIDIQADQLKSFAEVELNSLKGRLKALRSYYDEQQLLAGDNERAKDQLRLKEERETTALNRKIFEKEKSTRRSQVIIDRAAGVVKAFATYPWPAAIIISALITAQTLSQIAIINRQKPGFKKGVIDLQGPGTGTSDSIPANLSRGESVMTAWETRHAGDVLKEIRAKKLDNRVLKSLKQGREAIQSQFDDGKIIKAIEKNRPPDVIEQSGIVYEVRKKGDTYINKIRAKSVRL